MDKFQNRVEPFAMGFLESDREDIGYKIACGLRERAKYMELTVLPNRIFAGACCDVQRYAFGFEFGSGVFKNEEVYKKKIQSYPQYKEEIERILKGLEHLDFYERVFPSVISELQKKQIEAEDQTLKQWVFLPPEDG